MVAELTEEDFALAAKKGLLPFCCGYCGKMFAQKVTGAHLRGCGAALRELLRQ